MTKIIQVTAAGHTLYALCEDGTVWYLEGGGWYRVTAKPWVSGR
jgi:hypothetical protein